MVEVGGFAFQTYVYSYGVLRILEVMPMEKLQKKGFAVLIDIVGVVFTAIGAIATVVGVIHTIKKDRNQKSNRPTKE